MVAVLDVIWHALRDSLLMAWELWWALVLGFAISAIVQAWVPRDRVERTLGAGVPGATARATALGAASSSCSYASVAIGRSLFVKGASAVSSLAFTLASTNLVWELGVVLWVLIGWQFTAGEYAGGLVMIGLIVLLARLFVSPQREASAREHAREAEPGHQHHVAATPMSLRARLTSVSSWSDVAHNFRGDWQMLWREIAIGLLLAGFAAQLPDGVFRALFLHDAPRPLPALESALVGPLIAVLSFVCSIGNVPLAAVLWSGGIGFAGVLAFLFADLIVLPIIAIYRRYYGGAYAARIVALMYTTMVLAALLVAGAFALLGLAPSGPRPTRTAIFGSVRPDWELALNVLAAAAFAALWWLTARRGATDPICGMTVDRASAVTRRTPDGEVYFCSEHCARSFDAAAHV
jgi:uncharacterized membrane protein YraQ (UPF0718 family)/YHS domain-containing protein